MTAGQSFETYLENESYCKNGHPLIAKQCQAAGCSAAWRWASSDQLNASGRQLGLGLPGGRLTFSEPFTGSDQPKLANRPASDLGRRLPHRPPGPLALEEAGPPLTA